MQINPALAQQRNTITGTVIDGKTKEAIIGATVSIKGKPVGGITDGQGKFSFSTNQKLPVTLIVNILGYSRRQVVLNEVEPITVSLKEDVNQLEEVKVVSDGYFTQAKKSYAGSSTVVTGLSNENKPVTNPLVAIQGQVAGLNVSIPNGQPGANVQVRLRGLGSTALNSNPLYVIDGMIINDGDLSRLTTTSNVLSGINQDDIESITVLKDASAAAIYGSRGSNGVIIITTKRGKAGKTQVNFDTEVGTTNIIPFPDAGQPLNADQFKELFLEGLVNAGTYTEAQIAALSESYGFNSGKSNNWQDLVFKTGKQQQYNVSVKGGNETTKIFTSAGYFNQEATTLESTLRRVSGLVNLDHKINKRISISTSLNFSNVLQLSPNGGSGSWGNPIFASKILRPFQLAYNDDGSLNTSSTGNLGYVAHYNVVYIAENDKRKLSQSRALGNTSLNWNIWDQLNFTSYVSADYNILEESQYTNPILGDGLTTKGADSEYYTRYFNWLTRNQLDYRYTIKGINDSYITLAIGQEAQKSQQYNLSASGTGFPLTQPSLTALSNAATPTSASASTANYSFSSLYSRIGANFKNKYTLNGSYRRDGSSVFGVNNRFGSFWSVGSAWNIDEEAFFKTQRILSSAKLRVSYGTTGNAKGISEYASRALSSYGSNYTTGNGQNYSIVGNPDLSWEKQKKFDIGADLGFFNNRLTITTDYYRNNIDGLVQSVSLSRTTGFSSVTYANSGAMENRGFELAIKGEVIKLTDFSWTSSFNIAFNHNEVTKLGNASGANGNYYLDKGYDYYTYYTRLYAGVDPANGTALWYTDGTKTATTTNYNTALRVPYRSASPKYFGGLSNTISFKGINFITDFYFNVGNYIVDGWSTRFYDGAYYTFNKYQIEYWNRWTTPGQVTDVPKYIAGGGTQSNSNSFSSRFLYDGSFIRLKNLSVGYDLTRVNSLKKNIPGISKLYVYGRGTNLWTKTFDSRLPYDPESGTVTVPQYKTFTLGLNVSF